MKKIIPIMHCFDNNYVIPASVAFYSMLENSDPEYQYNLYVLHSDITDLNQNKLKETISYFKNASLEFINMQNKFQDLFEKTKSKGHYSKEMFYKFLAPSIFPQYDKIMIADVDVVYLGDISENFIKFDLNEDYYLAAHKGFYLKNGPLENFYKCYEEKFSQEEISKLQMAAGYYIFNLKKMREEHIEQKMIECAVNNLWRIIQPEQDVINLICYPKVKLLPLNSIVCTYVYELYKTKEDLNNDYYNSADEIKFAMENPIQLHYATNIKPWKYLSSLKADIWFKYLAKTNFLSEYLQSFKKVDVKKYFNLCFSISKNRRICLEFRKEVNL